MALLPLFLYVRKKPLVKYFISINSLKHFFYQQRELKGFNIFEGKKKTIPEKMWHRMALTCILSYLESFHYEVLKK